MGCDCEEDCAALCLLRGLVGPVSNTLSTSKVELLVIKVAHKVLCCTLVQACSSCILSVQFCGYVTCVQAQGMTCARMSNKDCDRFVVYGVCSLAESGD